jgi:DNA polymerase elongation subunit (family B)
MPQTLLPKLRKQPRRDDPFTAPDKLIAEIREFARVFGVDFFSVISRGSQFKVESFMFRIAKPESFVLRSPSKQEVTRPIFDITSL